MSPERAPHVVAYIEWIDSGTIAPSWAERDEVLGKGLVDAKDPIRSGGILLHEDDDGVVIALASNDTHDEVGGAWWIPRSAIRHFDKWLPCRPGGRE